MSEERFENGENRTEPGVNPEPGVYSGNMSDTPEVPAVPDMPEAEDSAPVSRNTEAADSTFYSRNTEAADSISYNRNTETSDSISYSRNTETSDGSSYSRNTRTPEVPVAPDMNSSETSSESASGSTFENTFRSEASAYGSETSASGPDLIAGTGSGSRAYAGGNSPSGTSGASESAYAETGRDAGSQEEGNRSRYYSYQRGPSRPSHPGKTRKPEQKKGKALAFVLAVILVFILGAGAGAYASGKSAKASLQGQDRITMGKSENSAETKKKNESAQEEGSPAGGDDVIEEDLPEENTSEEKKDTAAGKSTISRVQSSDTSEEGAGSGVADVAEKVMPSIVSVYNKFTQEAQFFGRPYTQEGQSTGSGIIIDQTDDELLIVTNNHVVEGADSLSVQFINEENCEALLKGTDPGSDLAVISVPLSELNAETRESIAIAELGSSEDLRIGERAIAIGNALGYGQSLTVGYISALNREMTAEDGITGTFIQTDAAINPGNSGGALLNSAGQVIGINSNKIGGSAIEGMGFAIPISKAIPIIEELKVQESKTRVSEEEQGALGILGITVTSDVASAYGLPVGAYVEEIIEGSAAQQSDLSQGDIITGINGQTINGMEALQEQLSFYKAGEEVTLTVQHPMEGGSYEEREITLTLSKRSDIQSSDSQGSGNQNRRQQEIPYEEEGGEDLFDMFPFGSFGF